MALRAGYFGLKRFEKNKLFNLAASTPADISPDNPIAGKNDVLASVDLLKDTTGWTGKQKITFPYYQIAPTFTRDGVTYTTDDKGVITATTNGQAATGGGEAQLHGRLNTATYVPMYLPIGKYAISPLCSDSDIRIQAATTYNSIFSGLSEYVYGMDVGYFEITANTNSDYKLEDGSVLCAIYISSKNTTKVWNNIKIFPLICLEKLFKLSPTFEPYHESVAEMLDGKFDVGGFISSSDDLDDIRQPGIYGVESAPTHSPENLQYYTLIVGEYAQNQFTQICFKNGTMYIRRYYNDNGTRKWDSWYKFTGTEVTPASLTKEDETKKATKKKVIKEEEE